MAKEKNKTELPKVMEGELQARLIKLREDAGLNISQMADALCLSEDVIQNLENEAFDLLAEPPYVRGYLRNYAKLGENPDDASELISRYEALRGADAEELDFQIKTSSTITTSSSKRLSPIWAQVLLLGALLGGIGLLSTIPEVNNWVSEKWQSFSSQLKPSVAKNNPSLLGELPVPAPLPEDELTLTPESRNSSNTQTGASNQQSQEAQDLTTENASTENTASSSTDAASTSTTTPTTETVPTTDTNSAENVTTPTTDTTQTQPNTEELASTTNTTEEVTAASSTDLIAIKLVFDKEVWLRIKDKDNKTVFEGLNKAETEKTVELKKPLTFRVGNAQGLSLFIDNKEVDISTYINGSIANFTLE